MPSATSAARPPSRTSSRVRLSYQGLCPNSSCKRASGLVISISSMLSMSTIKREELTRPRRDVLGRVAELLHHSITGRRRAVVVDRHAVVGVLVPPEAHARFDRERRDAGRQHVVAVLVGLELEAVPR